MRKAVKHSHSQQQSSGLASAPVKRAGNVQGNALRKQLPDVIAMKMPDDRSPWYWISRHGGWTRNPRKATPLANHSAQRIVARLADSHTGPIFACVNLVDARRLFRLQERRGDIRNLASPEEPGGYTLKAQSQD